MSAGVTINAAGALTGILATDPVVANFAAFGLFFVFLAAFAGNAEGLAGLVLALCGCLLALAGAALVLRSRAELGAAWSLVPTADQDTGLVTTGPYHLIRHPSTSACRCSRWARPLPSAAGLPSWLCFPRLCRRSCGAHVWRRYF
ncbi:hypothetical protein D3227_36405 [Mesorhizobium waimense]|uniref:Uncharacterized protein n=1 Tax=Mesorhizobium waimense TaxID=1300307 RepID=A0A3A5JY23_9HYPH|nr:hypothetical protein D3227_36405 [Mesorhizobium waimense]